MPVILGLAVFLVLVRLAAYDEPIEWDIGTYMTVGREMLAGERLYDQVWADVKPPGVYVTFAAMQAVAGDGFLAVYLLSVIAAVVTLAGIYYAASVAGPLAGALGATFWAAMCFDPGMGANLPNTEVFINAAVAWAFALWVRGDVASANRSWGRWSGIALLFFLASTYKQVALAPAICLGLVELVATRALARVLVMAAVGVLAWAALFGYFGATGRGWIAWQTLAVSSGVYGGSQVQNLIDSLKIGQGLPRQLAYTLPAAALAVIGAVMRKDAAPRRAWLLLAALVVGTHLAVALPGQFFPHYHQLWFVPLSIGAGWGAAALSKLPQPRGRALARVGVALAALAVLYPQLTWLPLSGEERARRKYGDFFVYANRALGDVNELLQPGETFYTWSDEAYAYPLTRRRLPAAGLWKLQTLTGPLAGWITQHTLDDLERNPPELFIHYGDPSLFPDHPIAAWSLAHYDPLPGENVKHFPLYFYVRRGGTLERRLAHSPATTSAPSPAP